MNEESKQEKVAPANVCVAMREAYKLVREAETRACLGWDWAMKREEDVAVIAGIAWYTVQARRAVRKAMDAMGMPRKEQKRDINLERVK